MTPAVRLPYRPGMNRRRFLLTSLIGVLAAPLGAEAQQARTLPRIGLLGPASSEQAVPFVAVVRQRMREQPEDREGLSITIPPSLLLRADQVIE